MLQGRGPNLNFSLTPLVTHILLQRLESKGALSLMGTAYDASGTSGCYWKACASIW